METNKLKKNDDDELELEEISQQEREENDKIEKFLKEKYGKYSSKINKIFLSCPRCEYGNKEKDLGMIGWELDNCPKCNHDIESYKNFLLIDLKIEDLKPLVNIDMVTKNRKDAIKTVSEFLLGEEYFISPKRDKGDKELFVYNNGIYEPFGQCLIEEYCKKIFDLHYTKHISNAIIHNIEIESRISEKELYDVKNEYRFAVLNGIYDLKSNKMYQFSPNEIYFSKMPVKYDKDCKQNKIVTFINEIIEDKREVQILKEFLGQMLVRNYNCQTALMFQGLGSNGKSVLLQILTNWLGAENIKSHSLSKFEKVEYAKAELLGKLANLGADIGTQQLKDSEVFRELTGSDWTTGERKFLTSITFKNYAKLIFCCNQNPDVCDDTPGFWRRWQPILFKYSYKSKEQIEELNQQNLKYVREKNTNLSQELITDDEMSSLLNWAIDGFQSYSINNKFTTAKNESEVKGLWLRGGNSLLGFCEENIKECDYNSEFDTKDDSYITVAEFNKEYESYCNYHQLKKVKKSEMKKYLSKRYGAEAEAKNLKNKATKVYRGVRLVNKDVRVFEDEIYKVKKLFMKIEKESKNGLVVVTNLEQESLNIKIQQENFDKIINKLKNEQFFFEAEKGYFKKL